jgi:hypothetical protein
MNEKPPKPVEKTKQAEEMKQVAYPGRRKEPMKKVSQ